MSNDDSLSVKVLNWVKNEGYTLEMRVARIFQQSGFSVSRFEPYVDPESDDLREVDVVASVNRQFSGIEVFVTLFVECKYLSKPWVVFVSPRRLGRFSYFSRILNNEFAVHEWRHQDTLQGRLLARILSSLGHQKISTLSLFLTPQIVGYGMTESLRGGLDHAYEAIMQVGKCVEAHDIEAETDLERAVELYDETKYRRDPRETEFMLSCSIAFPIIVGKGKLFECYLDENSETIVSEVDESVILVPSRRRRDTGGARSSSSVLRVVTEKRLEYFATEAFEAASALLSQERAIEEVWEYERDKAVEGLEAQEIPF